MKRRFGEGGEVQEQDVESLVGMAARMGGRGAPADLADRVTVMDLTRGSAMIRIDAPDWIDFLLLARIRGEWKIVQVLWETAVPAAPRRPG